MIRQVESEGRFLARSEHFVYGERLNWVYGALPLVRVVTIAIGIQLVRTGSLGLWIIPVGLILVQTIRLAGFTGELGYFTVVGAVALIWAGVEYGLDDRTRNIFFWAFFFGAVVKGVLDHYYTRLYLTNKRILLRTGILTTRRSMLPIRALTDMRYDQPFIGQMFNYGHFYVESAGQDQALSALRFVDDPVIFYTLVGEEGSGSGSTAAGGDASTMGDVP